MATVARPQQPDHVPPTRRAPRAWIPNLILSVLLLVLAGVVAAGIALAALTRDLPSIAVLDDPNSLGFKTAQIFDRKGQLLWEIDDPSGGKRVVVPLSAVAPDLINATLAAEDI